jgi:hypothetical protein
MARGPEPLIGIASCFHRRRAFESMYEADTALALDLDAERAVGSPGAWWRELGGTRQPRALTQIFDEFGAKPYKAEIVAEAITLDLSKCGARRARALSRVINF